MPRSRLAAATALVLALLVGATACSAEGEQSAAPARITGSPASAPTSYDQYVALGDSYTAAPLVPPTDTTSVCLRSAANYPALVARAMPGTTLTDVSCSGATTANMRTPQIGVGGESVPPQFDALRADTDLVTIGVGGNDERLFGGVLGECIELGRTDPAGAPCQAKNAGAPLDETFAHIRANVAGVVRGVRARSPRARVVVVGYPQIVPASGTCERLPFATGDYPFARSLNQRLAEAVRLAAADAGADYVDLWGPSQGHDTCSADPWINGRVTSADRALAYHPLAVEQQAVADLVLATIR